MSASAKEMGEKQKYAEAVDNFREGLVGSGMGRAVAWMVSQELSACLGKPEVFIEDDKSCIAHFHIGDKDTLQMFFLPPDKGDTKGTLHILTGDSGIVCGSPVESCERVADDIRALVVKTEGGTGIRMGRDNDGKFVLGVTAA